jgi:hypothetical protein
LFSIELIPEEGENESIKIGFIELWAFKDVTYSEWIAVEEG